VVAGVWLNDGLPPTRLTQLAAAGASRLGIRPEYLRLATVGEPGAAPARLLRVQDLGTGLIAVLETGGALVRARLAAGTLLPAEPHLKLLDAHSCFYADEELVP
jgi:glycerol transport system ATP-binding protein